ncbi:ribosomal RNA processing protein 36 homolog [Cucumis sativus]|uniref:rRNA biogenesis protein RRP36 n=1 Tax=Cucumis sativus TaxID=3659 RepID=A0A0A0KUS3_CUCSA|nr:ribosomal RNA processing protein 36 homolog [Cucumis sativus]
MKKYSSSVPSSGKQIVEEESEDLESSSSDESLDSEEENIERELADVTFEELQRARSDGSHSMYQKTKQEKKSGRANKNRPMEVSSRKPVSRFREVIQAPKNMVRDPRFESLSGTLDADGFKKRYSFIYEKTLPAEKEELKKQLRKTNDPNVAEELKKQLSWIDKQFKSDSTKRVDAAILAKHKKKEREAAKHGKKPFYLKKSEIRKQRLVEKYTNLKSTGKLDAYVERKRRKNAAKDRRYIPYQRSSKLDEQD